MPDKNLNKILNQLVADYFVFAPQLVGVELKIIELRDLDQIDWSAKTPVNSWKAIFLPACERLFDANGRNLKPTAGQQPLTAALNMNVLDLRALTLFDQVFSNDVYYQNRRKNTLVVGYASEWPIDYKKYKFFKYKFEENIMEHLVFDIFLVRLKNNIFKFYTGSKTGQDFLNNLKIKDFSHVEFTGGVLENSPSKKMLDLEQRVTKSFNRQLWDKLDKICLACGKCSLVCPTCFCFDLTDKTDLLALVTSRRDRCWSVCFYNDFSRLAGGFKPLDSVRRKIYFWYVHKFVRIPREYKMPGCVSCGRCAQVCPVGIDISKNIAEIMKMKIK